MNTIVSKFAFVLAAAGVSLAGAGASFAQSDKEMELIEARAALQIATRKLAGLEKRSAELEKANLALGESLAAANAEANEYQESYRELRLQMEALGVEAILPGSDGLEQRLLKAVSDNRLLEEEKKRLIDNLVRLSEATMNYLAAGESPGADARKALEEEMSAAGEAIALGGEEAPPKVVAIDEAVVIHLKPEYGLVVLDAGTTSGARVGMPIQLRRDERIVATATVVDVRSKICGAIVQGVAQKGETVQVGDQVELRTDGTL
jgi:hypothetical protein